MNQKVAWVAIAIGVSQLAGCSLAARHAASTRMEAARSANAGKDLVPRDGGTYLIPVGQETVSYLGSGDTDWKINNTSFTQPRGTYSVVRVSAGTYAAHGNKRVAGGGESTLAVEVREREVICLYVVNPLSAPARIQTYKGDACDPILRPLKQQNVIGEVK
jgi:hypothetical protein